MTDRRFYEVAVPTTITVLVSGDALQPEKAISEAVRFAESLAASENEAEGYSSVAFADGAFPMAIARADVDVTGVPTATDTTEDQFED